MFRQKVGKARLPVPFSRAPSSRDGGLNVAWSVVDKKEFVRLIACSRLYGGKKIWFWFCKTKVCRVVDSVEMALETQNLPNIFSALMLLNRCEMQFQAASCSKLSQLPQQIAVDMGVLLEPITDKRVGAHILGNGLQRGDKS